jgi:redox-sensitive bicupin YhaK (pirin superfamily)
MSAGTGILHSEKNDAWRLDGRDPHTDPVHFVQMWVIPDEPDVDPGYEQLEIGDELLRGGLVPVASGMDRYADASAIRIRNRYATLHAARLGPGDEVTLPDAPFVHLHVPDGAVTLEGSGLLGTGDAPAHHDRRAAGHRHRAAEILVWRCTRPRLTPPHSSCGDPQAPLRLVARPERVERSDRSTRR